MNIFNIAFFVLISLSLGLISPLDAMNLTKKQKYQLSCKNDIPYVTFKLGQSIFCADIFDLDNPNFTCCNGKRKGKLLTNPCDLGNAKAWIEQNRQKLEKEKNSMFSKQLEKKSLTPMPSSHEFSDELKHFLETHEITKPLQRSIVISEEDMLCLHAAVDELTKKWKFPKKPTLRLINGLNAYADSTNFEVSIGLEHIDFFSDEETIGTLSHEFAHLKKRHSVVSIACFLSYLLCLGIMGELDSMLLLFSNRTLPLFILGFAYISRSFENESDILGELINQNFDSSISVFIKFFLKYNHSLDKMKPTIEENLELISQMSSKLPILLSAMLWRIVSTHPPDYDRIKTMCDLKEQCVKNCKTPKILDYEKYAMCTKFEELYLKGTEKLKTLIQEFLGLDYDCSKINF